MSPRRPILLLCYGGFVTRNILLGDFAARVLRDRPLIASVIDPQDPLLRDHFAGQAVTLIPHPTEQGRERSRLEKIRDLGTYIYYFETGLREERTPKQIIQAAIEDGHSAWGARGVIALQATGRMLGRLGLMTALEGRYLRRIATWPATRAWVDLLRRLDPAAVVSTMLTLAPKLHPSVDLPPILAARELGLPCGTIVQSWDNLLIKPSILPPFLDRVWTWSEWMSSQVRLQRPELAADQIQVVGAPVFDFHHRADLIAERAEIAELLGLDPAKKWLVFGTGTPKGLPYEHWVVRDLCRELTYHLPEAQILVRLHPKDYGERWAPLAEEFRRLGVVLRRTATDTAMDLGGVAPPKVFFREQLSCLKHAAVVLNSSSTLSVDAALLDRPVVCIAYDPELSMPISGRARAAISAPHFRRLVETGGVAVVRSAAEARAAILRYLADPAAERAERAKMVERVTLLDGRAGLRLAEAALALADQAR